MFEEPRGAAKRIGEAMKARFISACAAAGVAATIFSATASADNGYTGSISFYPNWGRPGDLVDIFGTCNDPKFTVSPISSAVLDAEDIIAREDGTEQKSLRSFGTVKTNAKPGAYKVSFKCGTSTVSGTFRVLGPAPSQRPSIDLSPAKGVPGSTMRARVRCADPSVVSSAALTEGLPKELADRSPGLRPWVATMTVKNVKPGNYSVFYHCGKEKISTTFTVLDPKSPAKKAQVPVKPKGAAETGDLSDA